MSTPTEPTTPQPKPADAAGLRNWVSPRADDGAPCPTCRTIGPCRCILVPAPPPPPQGGTPECDELLKNLCEAKADPIAESIAFHQLAKKFERQRNEARAALAAALAEVEENRRMWAHWQAKATQAEGESERSSKAAEAHKAAFDALRAELEQTRRDRDNWKASAEVRAHERKIACERLTAAEQRADGAEKERDALSESFMDAEAKRVLEMHKKKEALALLREATTQRDTAIRERDEALRWPKAGDEDLPEDDAIIAAHPLGTGRHDLYQTAMRLVGAKRSKAGLVALVNWLLAERAAALAAKTTEGGERNL